jgi:hypothetical protein
MTFLPQFHHTLTLNVVWIFYLKKFKATSSKHLHSKPTATDQKARSTLYSWFWRVCLPPPFWLGSKTLLHEIQTRLAAQLR